MESPKRLPSKRSRNGTDNETINEETQQSYASLNKRKRKSKSSIQVDNNLMTDNKEPEQITETKNVVENGIQETSLISKNAKESVSSKASNLSTWVGKTYSSGIDKQKFIKKIHGKNAIKYVQNADNHSQNETTSPVYDLGKSISQHKNHNDKNMKTGSDETTECYSQRELDSNSGEKYIDPMKQCKSVQIVKSSKSNPQQNFSDACSNSVLVNVADLQVPNSSVISTLPSANIIPISQDHFNETPGHLINKPTPSFDCPSNAIQTLYASGNHASQIALQNFPNVVTHQNHLSTTSSVYTTSPCNISHVMPSLESHQTITSVLPILQDTSTQSFSQLQNLTESPSTQQTSFLKTNESQSTAFIERTIQNISATSDIPNVEFSSLQSSVNISRTSVVPIPSTSSGQVTTSSLRVENWGTYLLQRLEVLLDKEAECDLILKFVSGESLKVHKVVISACTSLINESLIDNCHNDDCQEEITMHPDLEYIWVEPVIRFVYSGRLDVRGSPSEMTEIYRAAQRLKVTLLIRLMDRRFPYLTPTHRTSSAKLPIWKRSPSKVVRQHRRETSSFGTNKTEEDLLSDHSETQQTKLCEDVSSDDVKNVVYGEDHSVYLLQTNSQKIALANAAVRRKRPAEEARPTRFELEEAEEDSDDIGTWTPRSSPPPLPNILAASPPMSNILTTSPNHSSDIINPNDNKTGGMKNRRQTRKTCYSAAGNSSKPSSVSNDNVSIKVDVPQSQDPFDLLTLASEQELGGLNQTNKGLVSNNENLSEYSSSKNKDKSAIRPQEKFTKLGNQDQWPNLTMCNSENKDCFKEIESSKENKNLDNKNPKLDRLTLISESNDNLTTDSNVSDSELALNDSKNLLDKIRTHLFRNKNIDSLEISPKKSILKKEQNIGTPVISKKRVSFPLDENNELINEVAIYSHAKEPAQSLLDVQKTSGSPRLTPQSSENTALKSNLGMRQKVLMNLSVSDTDATSYSSHSNDNKDGTTDDSENVASVSQGDMSSHAKIISEVLKKYPQLVKDKKNIRLKILKKGNDKTLNGKVVKSKVQYLVLSDTDNSKSKNSSRISKNLTNCKLKETGNLSRNAQLLSNSQQFNCPECTELSFPTYFTFKKHVTLEHKEKSTTILDSIDSVPYACYTCFLNEPIEFSDYCSYQQHMKDVHSKSEARLCNVCGFRPGRKLELAYHQYTEHNIGPPRNISFPKCDLCDHVAMNDSALLKHRSQHSNADNYTCATCGVAFRSFGALQGHMQTKLCQNKPAVTYTCPHCPLTFARSYNLKAHLKANHRSTSTAIVNQVIPVASAETSGIKTGNCSLSGVNIEANETSMKQVTVGSDVMAPGVDLACGSVIQESVSQAGHQHQGSSEAEALNTVANSLAASLGLPEENINQYMFTTGSNMDKYDVSQNSGGALNIQLLEAAATANTTHVIGTQLGPGVGVTYSMGDQVASLCQEGTVYTSQATAAPPTSVCGTAIGTQLFGPMGGMMAGGQIISTNQLVGGPPLAGQIVATGQMVAVTAASVIATTTASPQGWTYVTYHLPTAGQVQTSQVPITNCDNQQMVDSLTQGNTNNQIATEMLHSQIQVDSNMITATSAIDHEEQQHLISTNSKINEPNFTRDNSFHDHEGSLNRTRMNAGINTNDSNICATEVSSDCTEPNNRSKNQGAMVCLTNTVLQMKQQQQQQQPQQQQQHQPQQNQPQQQHQQQQQQQQQQQRQQQQQQQQQPQPPPPPKALGAYSQNFA